MTRQFLTALSLLAFFAVTLPAETVTDRLPRSTPEAEGVSSEGLAALITDLDEKIDAMNSVMIMRHGKVIAEAYWAPNSAETTHVLYSLTKSFTSTAIGLPWPKGNFPWTIK